MKRVAFLLVSVLFLAACHESLEERAAREAREYTERCCPTPVVNYCRTDSVAFDIGRREYTYYCSFVDLFDNEAVINSNRAEIHDGIREMLSGNVGLKTYAEAGFSFTYIVRSGCDPAKVLYKDTFTFGK